MVEDKKDTINEERKRKSDLINNKIKWPFVIFFVIGIFVAISIVARVYQDKFNDLYTPALYLFSTIAQTMGALLGIGMALLYTAVSNMRPNSNMPALEPAKRLLIKDKTLLIAINMGLLSISFACFGLLIILLFPNLIESFYMTYPIIGLLSICLAIVSIISTVEFARYRYNLYLHPFELLTKLVFEKKPNGEIAIKDIDNYKNSIEITEICILLSAFGNKNEYTQNVLDVIYDDIKSKNLIDIRISIQHDANIISLSDNNLIYKKSIEELINQVTLKFESRIKKDIDIIERMATTQLFLDYLIKRDYDLLFIESLVYLYCKNLSKNFRFIGFQDITKYEEVYLQYYNWLYSTLNTSIIYDLNVFIPWSFFESTHYRILENINHFLLFNINESTEKVKTKQPYSLFIDVLILVKLLQVQYFIRRYALSSLTHNFINIITDISPEINAKIVEYWKLDYNDFFENSSFKFNVYDEYMFYVSYLSGIVFDKPIKGYDKDNQVINLDMNVLLFFAKIKQLNVYVGDLEKEREENFLFDEISFNYDVGDYITKCNYPQKVIDDHNSYVKTNRINTKRLISVNETLNNIKEDNSDLASRVKWVPGRNIDDLDAHLR